MSEFIGEWSLVGAKTDRSELDESVDTSFDAEFAVLGKSASDLVSQIEKLQGFTLVLADDGTFKQDVRGSLRTDWFDIEGVLVVEIQPFNGFCNVLDDRSYLIANDRAKWATSKDEKKRQRFRHDDGDTVICDFVELQDNRLFHTINVLTDGHYVNRVFLVYERKKSA